MGTSSFPHPHPLTEATSPPCCPPQASYLHPVPSNPPCTPILKASLSKAQPDHANPGPPLVPCSPGPLSFPPGPCYSLVTPRARPWALWGTQGIHGGLHTLPSSSSLPPNLPILQGPQTPRLLGNLAWGVLSPFTC